jgi:hypothetical protein
MINAAPAAPAASVIAFSASGRASGETAASCTVETREGMANPFPKLDRRKLANLEIFEKVRVDRRQSIFNLKMPNRMKSATFLIFVNAQLVIAVRNNSKTCWNRRLPIRRFSTRGVSC